MNPSIRSKSFFKIQLLREEIDRLSNDNIYVPFITVAETWLKPFISDHQLSIDRYTVYRADRKRSKNGGVLIFVNNDITIDFSFSYDDDICNAIICVSKQNKIIVGCIYRPPSADDISFSNMLCDINKFIEEHSAEDKFDTVLFGDFNFPLINWNYLSSSKLTNSNANSFFHFIDSNFLTQYVKDSTRKNNLLDLFLCDNPCFVQSIETNDVGYSDHRLLKVFSTFFPLQIKGTFCQSKADIGLDFSNFIISTANFKAINKELSHVDWDNIVGSSLNDFPDMFRKTVFAIVSRHCKLRFNSNGKLNKKSFFSKRSSIINRKVQKLKNRIKYSNYADKKDTILNKIKKLEECKKQLFLENMQKQEGIAVDKVRSDSRYFLNMQTVLGSLLHHPVL